MTADTLTARAPRPRGLEASGRGLTRHELVGWACALFFVLWLSDRAQVQGLGASLLLSMDSIGLIAWACIATLLVRDRGVAAPARAGLAAILLLGGLGATLVGGKATFLFMTALGALLLATPGWHGSERRVGAILLAIAGQRLWAKIFAVVFADPIMRLDTAVAGMLMQIVVPGSTWTGNQIKPPHDVGIVVELPCSSFANLSMIALCYTALSALDGGRFDRRNLVAVVAAGLVMIALNTVRLLLMARSLAQFDYWHNGPGSEIFAIGMSVAAAGMCSVGSRWANRRG